MVQTVFRAFRGGARVAVMLILAMPALAQPAVLEQAPKKKTLHGLVFKEVEGKKLRLDLFLPEGKGPHPVALVLHGGGWRRGSRRSFSSKALTKVLLRQGIAAACADYRLVPRYRHPTQVQDCRRALQYLRYHAKKLGCDPDRVAAAGSSAGAHLAAMLGAERDHAKPNALDPVARMSTRPDLVISFFGPMDLAARPEKASAMAKSMVMQFLDCDRLDPKTLKKARTASPLHALTPGAPPFSFRARNPRLAGPDLPLA